MCFERPLGSSFPTCGLLYLLRTSFFAPPPPMANPLSPSTCKKNPLLFALTFPSLTCCAERFECLVISGCNGVPECIPAFCVLTEHRRKPPRLKCMQTGETNVMQLQAENKATHYISSKAKHKNKTSTVSMKLIMLFRLGKTRPMSSK